MYDVLMGDENGKRRTPKKRRHPEQSEKKTAEGEKTKEQAPNTGQSKSRNIGGMCYINQKNNRMARSYVGNVKFFSWK